MDDSKARIMHEAAQRVLARYESSGDPFTLFLSSWSFDEVQERVGKLLEEIGYQPRSTRKRQGRIGLERRVRISLQQQGFATVAVYRKGDDRRIAQPQSWPALTLSDDEWRGAVVSAVDRADLITLFWGSASPGANEEWELCASGKTPLKTVLVVPATELDIQLSELRRTFPHVVPFDEMRSPDLPAVFEPLVRRMKKIMRLTPRRRSALIDPKKRLREHPLPRVRKFVRKSLVVVSH